MKRFAGQRKALRGDWMSGPTLPRRPRNTPELLPQTLRCAEFAQKRGEKPRCEALTPALNKIVSNFVIHFCNIVSNSVAFFAT